MMNSVKNIKTGRLVYRESPDFKPSYGILNAVLLDLGIKDDLIEIDVKEPEWQKEIDLRQAEQPPTTQAQIDEIKQRLMILEKHDH